MQKITDEIKSDRINSALDKIKYMIHNLKKGGKSMNNSKTALIAPPPKGLY